MYKLFGVPGEIDGIIRQISIDSIETLDAVDTNETITSIYFDVSRVWYRAKPAVEEHIKTAILGAVDSMFSGRPATYNGWVDASKKLISVSITSYLAKGLTHYKKKVQVDA